MFYERSPTLLSLYLWRDGLLESRDRAFDVRHKATRYLGLIIGGDVPNYGVCYSEPQSFPPHLLGGAPGLDQVTQVVRNSLTKRKRLVAVLSH